LGKLLVQLYLLRPKEALLSENGHFSLDTGHLTLALSEDSGPNRF